MINYVRLTICPWPFYANFMYGTVLYRYRAIFLLLGLHLILK